MLDRNGNDRSNHTLAFPAEADLPAHTMIVTRDLLSNLRDHDIVVLYPSFGYRSLDRRAWRIDVCGTVYDAGSISRRKQMLVRLLQRVARVRPTESEQALFERRVRAFIAPTERGKRVVVRLGDEEFPLRKRTRRNGRFFGTMRIPIDRVPRLRERGDLRDGWLTLEVTTPEGNARQVGRVRLLDDEGLSVISDIDDTLKVTEVHCRRALIANTFLREFRAIDGMADRYRRWEAEGAAFHYVSSSPWQLFDPLAELFGAEGFPAGSFHLRSFQLREHMLRRLLLIRRRGKATSIRSILRRFPRRTFVLIGDSGERDPEIYGTVARRHASQVRAIYIRHLCQNPLSEERMRKSFRGMPRCHAFTDAHELPDSLGNLVIQRHVSR